MYGVCARIYIYVCFHTWRSLCTYICIYVKKIKNKDSKRVPCAVTFVSALYTRIRLTRLLATTVDAPTLAQGTVAQPVPDTIPKGNPLPKGTDPSVHLEEGNAEHVGRPLYQINESAETVYRGTLARRGPKWTRSQT